MKRSKFVAVLLSICLLVGMLPMLANAETACIGGSIFSVSEVYFGNDGEPVKWLMLNSGVMITADVVDTIAYNAGGLSNVWADSDAKAWCDAYESTFTDAELSVLQAVSDNPGNGSYYGTTWDAASLSEAKVYFLSAQEVNKYFGDHGSKNMAAGDGWWLRSPYTGAGHAISAGAVSDVGFVGKVHVAKTMGARPAVKLDPSTIVMYSAAANGKNDTFGAVANNESGEWKMTMNNGAYNDFAVSDISVDGTTVTVAFSGAATGEKESVSAVLKNQNGRIVAYGPISTGVAAGTATFEIPDGITGENMVIGVFNEQRNGDYATDFSSAITESDPVTIQESLGNVESWGLNLNDNISVSFKMNIATPDANAAVRVTVKNSVTNIPVSEVKANGNIITVNLAAAQMTDTISLQIVDSQANYSAKYDYTIREYADYLLANSDDENEKNLVKAMLNYGGQAQSYFDYNTGNIASDDIILENQAEPENTGKKATVSGSLDGIAYYGNSLIAESKTTVRYYFSVSGDINDYSFTCNDKPYTVQKKGDYYIVTVDGLCPDDLAEDVTLVVSNGSNSMSVSYSPMVYMERMFHKDSTAADLKTFIKALYNYHLAALAYTA